MPVTTTNWKDIPIPHKMRALQKDARGYPIPYVVLRDSDGTPIFTANDVNRVDKARRERRCGICGTKIAGLLWFLGGPKSAFHEHGCYIDGGMHHECMQYAVRVCPYLLMAKYTKRVDFGGADMSKLPELICIDPTTDPNRPQVFVAVAARTQRFKDGYVFPGRPYARMEFWLDGQRLTKTEAMPFVGEALRAEVTPEAIDEFIAHLAEELESDDIYGRKKR